jgi:hypothetical protein
MTELAFVSFLAFPSFVEGTKYSLWVYPKWYLLNLYWFEQCSFFLLPFLLLQFLFSPKFFFLLFG